MIHGLLWFPLLIAFVLLTALGWLERRRQALYRSWAKNSELAKLDSSGAARKLGGTGRKLPARFFQKQEQEATG